MEALLWSVIAYMVVNGNRLSWHRRVRTWQERLEMREFILAPQLLVSFHTPAMSDGSAEGKDGTRILMSTQPALYHLSHLPALQGICANRFNTC